MSKIMSSFLKIRPIGELPQLRLFHLNRSKSVGYITLNSKIFDLLSNTLSNTISPLINGILSCVKIVTSIIIIIKISEHGSSVPFFQCISLRIFRLPKLPSFLECFPLNNKASKTTAKGLSFPYRLPKEDIYGKAISPFQTGGKR